MWIGLRSKGIRVARCVGGGWGGAGWCGKEGREGARALSEGTRRVAVVWMSQYVSAWVDDSLHLVKKQEE